MDKGGRPKHRHKSVTGIADTAEKADKFIADIAIKAKNPGIGIVDNGGRPKHRHKIGIDITNAIEEADKHRN